MIALHEGLILHVIRRCSDIAQLCGSDAVDVRFMRPGKELLPVVRGSAEDIVGAPQLLQVCQPLELWGVYDLHSYGIQPEVAMHRVIEQLHRTQND